MLLDAGMLSARMFFLIVLTFSHILSSILCYKWIFSFTLTFSLILSWSVSQIEAMAAEWMDELLLDAMGLHYLAQYIRR